MYQGQTETQFTKDKDETPTLMVHTGHINETITLCLPTEEEWSQTTPEDHDLSYIKHILYGLEETPFDSKKLSNKGYVKPF